MMYDFIVGGMLVATPAAIDTFNGQELHDCLLRHLNADWGDLGPEDKASNDEALRNGGRLLSSYKLNGKKMWIITEADHSVTTILLPEEY